MIDVKITSPRKGRVMIEARRDGSLLFCETLTQGDMKATRRAAKALRYDVLALQERLLAEESFEIAEAAEAPPQMFGLRRIDESRDTARYFATLDEALAASIPEGVIEWTDKKACCLLDIDYHSSTPPDAAWLMAQAQRLKPRPSWVWLSRGGGLHAVYFSQAVMTADELAAVALLSFKHLDVRATGDLLTVTRTPPSEYFRLTPNGDLSEVARFLGSEVSGAQVAEYLDAAGLSVGSTYPHSECPLRPEHPSHGTPVFVSEHGLHCKSCEAGGYCYGSRKPGFFPFTALCGGGPSSVIRRMAQRFCHWEHASIVLRDRLGLEGETARLCWQAMLHLLHGDDPRVDKAMNAGRDMIRLDKRWTTRDALATYTKDIGAIIGALPACQTQEGGVIGEQVQRFLQPIDLDEEGYPTVTPIRGIRMYQLPIDEQISHVVPNYVLRPHSAANRRPRYVAPNARIADPWGILEEPFPGLNREYLTLLIAAKGVAESEAGLAPNIIVAGPSSSGKTQSVHIAAAILGDKATEVSWQGDIEKFRQAYAMGAEVGSFVSVNELLKDAERTGSSAIQAMDAFLNLTPDSLTHKLYKGATPLGKNPATVVTDICVPQGLRDDKQISRRFVYVHLTKAIDWINSVVESGVHKFERLRLADERYAAAADAIVSQIIDRWFRERKTLVDIAVELGYSTLDTATTGFEDPIENLIEFYEAWKRQTPSTETRWHGGWRTIRRGDGTRLADAWDILSDGGKNWGSSRKVSEQDWTRVLKCDKPVRCLIRLHGKTLGIKFEEDV